MPVPCGRLAAHRRPSLGRSRTPAGIQEFFHASHAHSHGGARQPGKGRGGKHLLCAVPFLPLASGVRSGMACARARGGAPRRAAPARKVLPGGRDRDGTRPAPASSRATGGCDATERAGSAAARSKRADPRARLVFLGPGVFQRPCPLLARWFL